MKCLVIYDSSFGNTEKVARSIGSALESLATVSVRSVKDVKPSDMEDQDLLIVGSPTQAFRPTKQISSFLSQLPPQTLLKKKVAAFDTRVRITDVNIALLTFMVNLFGYAAQPIARGLQKKGGNLVKPPEGFFVEDKEGPLLIGEFERAGSWARSLAAA